MAPRPTWKGYLRLSLVSCPVRLYPATTRSERVSFHLLDPKTGNRIQMRPHDPETGREVSRDQLVRGYEVDKGRYVMLKDEELEALQVESSETIDLIRFVDQDEVDPVYFDMPYFLTSEGRIADETFRVIHEAMHAEGKAGIGRVVLSTREHPIILSPRGRGMVLMTLRSDEEVRKDRAYFEDIGEGALDKEMVELARRIIAQKAGPFDPKELTGDRYQEALRELIARKVHGEKPAGAKARPTGGNVVDLMDALKRSLASEERKAPAASKKSGQRQAVRSRRTAAPSGRRS
jgi:DNA end-binding protein Ku